MSRPGPPLVALGCVLLAATFAGQLRLVMHASRSGAQATPGVVDPHSIAAGIVAALVALALVQCAALALLARARAPRSALATGAVLAALAAAPAPLVSADPYAYAGYALLPSFRAAYAPPRVPPPPAFSAVTAAWGLPLVPCVYGPLWLAADRAVLSGAPDLERALLRLRCCGIAGWAALTLLVATTGRYRRFLPLVAANPGIAALYVAGAHNDLWGVTAVVAAGVAGRRVAWRAVPLAALAIAWKIVYLPLVLCPGPRPRGPQAYGVAAAAAALGLGASFVATGPAYLAAIRATGKANAAGGAVGLVHVALFLAAAAVLLAAALRPTPRAASWLPMTMAAQLYPWYAIWCLPLALQSRAARIFLITLPLVAAVVGIASPVLGYTALATIVTTVAARDLINRRPSPLRLDAVPRA